MNFQIYNFPLFFSYNLGKKPLCPPKYFVFLCFRKQMKKLLIFQEMKLFKLKNSCFFRRTLRVFIIVSLDVFIFSCFHFFRCFQVSSLLIAFIYFTILHCCCCYRDCYGFEKAFFTLMWFLPYTYSQHLAQPAFIKAFLGLTVQP